jgi:hypothetical protein
LIEKYPLPRLLTWFSISSRSAVRRQPVSCKRQRCLLPGR